MEFLIPGGRNPDPVGAGSPGSRFGGIIGPGRAGNPGTEGGEGRIPGGCQTEG